MFGKKKQALLADYSNEPRLSANVTEFMEKLGLSDEEIAEMANPVTDLQRTINESEAALGAFVTETNATWSTTTGTIVDLQPHHMLPKTCWDALDERDQILLKELLGLLPTQPWNILLLAMNEETATLTGAGRYPTIISEEAATANNLVGLAIADELDQIKRQQETATDHSTDFEQLRQAAAARIIAMARPVAATALGQDVVDHSRSTFFGD